VDVQLNEFDDFLKREENQIMMKDIKAKMEMAKKAAEDYEAMMYPEDNQYSAADMLIDNKLLLARVDAVFGNDLPNPDRHLCSSIISRSHDFSQADTSRLDHSEEDPSLSGT
jgi:hypothetical protein